MYLSKPVRAVRTSNHYENVCNIICVGISPPPSPGTRCMDAITQRVKTKKNAVI